MRTKKTSSPRFLPYSLATDGGVHRRCTPEMYASDMSWLGEPPTAAQAHRYEVHRKAVMREELGRLTALHSVAEGAERARLADQMNALHAALAA